MELYNDDCLKILPTLEEDSIDMVLVDLPYGQTACKWDSIIDLEKMWKQLNKVCKPTTAMVFFTTTKFGNTLINSNPKQFRYDLVWEKSVAVGFLNARKMPLRSHEMMYVFYEKLPTYNPQKTEGKPYKRNNIITGEAYGLTNHNNIINNKGDRFPTSVIKTSSKRNKHPTAKPVELCEWLIKSYSNENDTVLDFTMGSGTTGVACKNLNRKFIGIEMDEAYFKICEQRLKTT
jgi:site-specific DNA-methyltransferase (adenine-specific)